MNQSQSENTPGPSTDLSDLRIGEFLLLRRLGSGGMADVYLAEQTSLGRHVAVKVLKSNALQASGDVLLRRFEQEARAAGGVSHPNLVQVITTGREGDIAYIVQEYVPGMNLSQWIRRNGPPDYGIGLKWLQQIASALRLTSESGIVHRDVKPENILLTRSGVAKVTDFGLAQLNQPKTPQMNLTQAGTTMGTPWYMSPEQIQGEKLDQRSDQYSLGVTAYHMFAGQPPFSGKNPVTVAVQHLKEKPLPLSHFRADLPKALCDVIERMMQKKPADRFPDAASLEQALQALNSVPVNEGLERSGGLAGILRRLRKPLQLAAVIVPVCAGLGYFGNRALHPPLSLERPAVSQQVARESTAARQFARAILQPDRQDLWRAVPRYFPGTSEADMALLQLGVMLMSSVVPDIDEAFQAFTEVREQGEIAPEKTYLQFLGMIGQAYALKDRERSAELELILSDIDERIEQYESDDVMQLDVDRAPEELQNFFSRILQSRRQQQANDDSSSVGGR